MVNFSKKNWFRAVSKITTDMDGYLYFGAITFYIAFPNHTKPSKQTEIHPRRVRSGQRIKLRRHLLCCLGDKTAVVFRVAQPQDFLSTEWLQALARTATPTVHPQHLWKAKGEEELGQRLAICMIKQSHCPLRSSHSSCCLVTSLLLFPGYSPHKENLFKTLMTPLQLYQMVQWFFITLGIKYQFHRGAMESDLQLPLCVLPSLHCQNCCSQAASLQFLKAARPDPIPALRHPPAQAPLCGRSFSAHHFSPFSSQLFFCSCDMDRWSPLSNHGQLYTLSLCKSVIWLCVVFAYLAHNRSILHPALHLLWQHYFSVTSQVPSKTHSFVFLELLSSRITNVQFSLLYYTLTFAWRTSCPSVDFLSFLRRLIMTCV